MKASIREELTLPPRLIRGLHHEISTTLPMHSFLLVWTQPLCNHPLYVPTTGMAPIILNKHVKMRSHETGLLIVMVRPCGSTHPMVEPLRNGWRKLTLKHRRVQQWSVWYQQGLTLTGGGRTASLTKLDSSEADLNLVINQTLRRSLVL